MAKKDTLTLEVNPDDLGVLSKHRVLMQTDQEYRDRALTPPGGYAPGEAGKDKDEVSGDVPAIPGVIQPAAATS
jgi:hypothetical protein